MWDKKLKAGKARLVKHMKFKKLPYSLFSVATRCLGMHVEIDEIDETMWQTVIYFPDWKSTYMHLSKSFPNAQRALSVNVKVTLVTCLRY